MPRCDMGHALIIFLKIQIAEAVWFLGLAPLFRLSDSFSPPALQVLVHRAVPGSGALSPAAKPPRQPGTAMCELIVLNKRPDQKYQEDHYSDPQYPEKYLDHIDKYHCRTAGGRIFFPGSCRLRSPGAVRLLRRCCSFCPIRCSCGLVPKHTASFFRSREIYGLSLIHI